jgi:hypothetical protein
VQEAIMAVGTHDTARQIGQAFAHAARREPSARRLWVSVRRDVVSLWLLTEAVDMETERRLYLLLDSMAPVAPGALIRLHVLNPRHGEEADIRSVVPAEAAEVVLHAART